MEIVKQSDSSPRYDQETDTQSTLEQERNSAMIKAAREDLGCGYDRQVKRVVSRVFDISGFNEKDFKVSDVKERYDADIGSNETKATETYNNAFTSAGKVSVLGVSGGWLKRNLQKDQSTKLYCAVSYFYQAKVGLSKDLQTQVATHGDSYVKSATVYAGYKILLEISTDEAVKQDTKKTMLGADLFSKLNINWEQSNESLNNKTDKRIIIKGMESYGGNSPALNVSTVTDIESLENELNRIRDVFRQNIRQYTYTPSIDSSDLEPYPAIDLEKLLRARRAEAKIPSESSIFLDLARDLLNKSKLLESHFHLVGGDKLLSLPKTLYALRKVFSETLPSLQNLERCPKSCLNRLLVLGPSGAGKTTCIVHLLGRKLIETTFEFKTGGSKDVLDCEADSSQTPSGNSPTIGHFRSETKGAKIYFKDGIGYVDTAGLLDTEGKESDLCNSEAVRLVASKKFPINRIIIVLDPASLSTLRGQLTKRILEVIGKIVPGFYNEHLWKNVLFYINPRFQYGENKIRREIDAVIKEMQDGIVVELAEIFYYLGAELKITDLQSQRKTLILCIQRIQYSGDATSKGYAQQAAQKLDLYDQLSLLTKDRFVIGNFTDENGRHAIASWLEQNPNGLTQEQINLGHLFEDGPSIFRNLLASLSSYFNKEFESLIEMQNKINDIVDKREIQSLKMEILSLENERANCQREIDQLKQSNEEIALPPIEGRPYPGMRSWWRVLDFMALTSKFEYKDSKTPIARVEQVTVNMPGRYIVKKADFRNGEYQVEYMPSWFNKLDDCRAGITLFVKKKDSPYIQGWISDLEATVQKLDQQIQDKQDSISRAEGKQASQLVMKDFEVAVDKLVQLESKMKGYLEFLELIDSINQAFDFANDIEMCEAGATFRNFTQNLKEYKKRFLNAGNDRFVEDSPRASSFVSVVNNNNVQ